MILLDANTLIHYVKGMQAVVARLQATPPRDVAIPSVVVYEFHYGTLAAVSQVAARRKEIIAGLLAGIAQVPFDEDAAIEAARIRLELERKGQVIGPMNLLIAGTAVSRGAALATSNTREFARVPGLHLVDWSL